ncbi:MAG TPA: phage major capsid protein [Verrucomicrobiae bacterium]|nr:phage major capsid protein [Verrucomicrobiae bacterium]
MEVKEIKDAIDLAAKELKEGVKGAGDKAEKALQEAAKALSEMEGKAEKAEIEALKAEALKLKDEFTESLKKEIKVIQDQHDKLSAKVKEADFGKAIHGMRRKALGDMIAEGLEKNAELIEKKAAARTNFEIPMETKAVATVADSVAPDFQPIQSAPHEFFHMRSIIPVSPTVSNAIRYVRMTIGSEGNTINTVAEGALKPELNYTPTVETANVYKVAGHLTVTDEFLEDIVGSRDWLASELPQALFDVEDEKILKGTGVGDIEGLYTIATPLSLPSGSVTAASNVWDKLAAALAQERRLKRQATGIIVSPEDYMELLINKGSNGMYTYPAIWGAVALNVAGVPVYQTSSLLQGEALVGDFSRGTRIFQRMGPVVRYAFEHANNFTSNLVTVLVEERIALPIYFPDSFISVDLSAGTA